VAAKLPWFLSGEPDVLTLLDEQVATTIDGIRAYVSWAKSGEEDDARAVRDAEHAADDARRAVAEALRRSLVTPLEPEDLYTMSERIDAIINGAKNAVRDAEALEWKADAATAQIADLILAATEQIAQAVHCIRMDPEQASKSADAATHHARQVEKVYRSAIVSLRDRCIDDSLSFMTALAAYRSQLAIADAITHVSHRIWYSVLRSA
jgi:uncharacterized protein Yka (UPF0111/DUF47 family)